MSLKERIEEWRRRLIDLSRRNRLLHFRPTKSAHLSISTPDTITVFDRLIIQEKSRKFWLPPESEETEGQFLDGFEPSVRAKQDELVCGQKSRTDLERTLKNMYRRSLSDYQERGVRILHVGIGLLRWKENESESVDSPLLLSPVELTRQTARDPYVLSPIGEDVTVNPALRAKLLRDYNMNLPEIPEEWEIGSLETYLSQVEHLVEPLGWTVDTVTNIGLFSFHKLVMYQDLDDNAEIIGQHDAIRSLAGEHRAEE